MSDKAGSVIFFKYAPGESEATSFPSTVEVYPFDGPQMIFNKGDRMSVDLPMANFVDCVMPDGTAPNVGSDPLVVERGRVTGTFLGCYGEDNDGEIVGVIHPDAPYNASRTNAYLECFFYFHIDEPKLIVLPEGEK